MKGNKETLEANSPLKLDLASSEPLNHPFRFMLSLPSLSATTIRNQVATHHGGRRKGFTPRWLDGGSDEHRALEIELQEGEVQREGLIRKTS